MTIDDAIPVDDSEFIFRRVKLANYLPGASVPIGMLAFRPSSADATGLSVSRERFTSVAELIASIPLDLQDQCVIVRI